MKKIPLIKFWLRARFGYYWYWRTTYPDGRKTRLLPMYEAKSLAAIFGGKARIDYGARSPKVLKNYQNPKV